MKIALLSLTLAAGFGLPVLTGSLRSNDGSTETASSAADATELYVLVKAAREDLREMRIAAGLHPHPAGPHIDPEGHHADDNEEQRKRERAEGDGHEDGRGERGHGEGGERGHGEGGERGHGEGGERGHGERGERGHGEGGERGHGEGGERGHGEGGERGRSESEGAHTAMPKMQKYDAVHRNGAHLTMQYNSATQAFVGSVRNTTGKTLHNVRVEIHLSNGRELGPTLRTDLAPGKTIPVELGAYGESFSTWVTHPEAGAGHGPGGEESGAAHEERERGEHGARGERPGEHGREGGEGRGEHVGSGGERSVGKPQSASLHPVHNQLRLLQGEMKAFQKDLVAKNAK